MLCLFELLIELRCVDRREHLSRFHAVTDVDAPRFEVPVHARIDRRIGKRLETPRQILSCLHPGRSARILRQGQEVGWLGELHPSLVKALEFIHSPVLFELRIGALTVQKPQYREISRFPQVRRDLAVVVDETVALSALAERVRLSASSLLSELRIFDVYRGPGIEAGRKSIALGLIFQDISRTLTDEDVERLIAAIVADLRKSLNARIRE